MTWDFFFFLNSILLGIGLAMDAFSVSLANGLSEPHMKKIKMSGTSFLFAFFQFVMPLIGWILVHTLIEYFNVLEKIIPFISLGLLLFIGIKMIIEGVKNKKEESSTSFLKLLLQGIATSIDALSVGFTIGEYDVLMAFIACLIIGIVTFIICFIGLFIGKKIGTIFSSKAKICGGIILILIGLEIFITGII